MITNTLFPGREVHGCPVPICKDRGNRSIKTHRIDGISILTSRYHTHIHTLCKPYGCCEIPKSCRLRGSRLTFLWYQIVVEWMHMGSFPQHFRTEVNTDSVAKGSIDLGTTIITNTVITTTITGTTIITNTVITTTITGTTIISNTVITTTITGTTIITNTVITTTVTGTTIITNTVITTTVTGTTIITNTVITTTITGTTIITNTVITTTIT
ncbi:hypothetical protein STEG23_012588, partial [Scotinomys teguina]